ncbi:HAMP domain-containing sensor histidine kinase [Lysobacter sp. Root983]|uniref:sensor histidine kinase n=1 Tax=Lysobacter sp. Root983 TaxID=1736613 RepID=UPI00070EA63B|nr:HAMP domain-containing sensor histidine kinase [Lysobacter sp. Root983]KRD77229.1 hypothetical protein ASE43_08700 [Lysobacter sp. Root983]
MNPNRRLQRRILLVLAGVTLAVAAVFSLYAVVFTYEVEDAFLNAQVADEAAFQKARRAETGYWGPTRDPRIQLHRSLATLPPEVAQLMRREPQRLEASGRDGRHYHVRALRADGEVAWLLYDVSRGLVVKPMRDSILWLLAWTSLIAVALALVAGYLVSRRITRRLSRLADEVDHLDPARLPSSWSSADGDDEVGAVAQGLEDMTARLRQFIERERGFTRDASHELRTPLAVIRAAGEQLDLQPELGPAARGHARLIRESTMHLEQTVDTLLTLAREEHADAPAVELRLLPLLEQIVLEQSCRLDGKPVQLRFDVPDSARVRAPAAVLRIVLTNLVGNAFAHTDAGTIRIGVEEDALLIRNPAREDVFPVSEEGVALFRKGDGSDGFGLGLTIVHRLCGRFGLGLRFESVDNELIARLPLTRGDMSHAEASTP